MKRLPQQFAPKTGIHYTILHRSNNHYLAKVKYRGIASPDYEVAPIIQEREQERIPLTPSDNSFNLVFEKRAEAAKTYNQIAHHDIGYQPVK